MKRVIVLALAVLMLASVNPQPANANIGAFLTWWDGGDMDNGFGGGVKYKIPLVPIVGLDVRASYVKFGDYDLYTIPLEAAGTLEFGLVYGGLALGYYIWGGNSESSSNRVGGSILAGINLALGGIGAFGELKYNVVKTELEIAGEKEADGFQLLLGVTF